MSACKPLKNICVLVTRAQNQSDSLAEKLAELGARSITIPVIKISPPESWQEFDRSFKLAGEYDWLVFASVNAVRMCFSRFAETGIDISDLASVKVAAIGPATAEALEGNGLKVSYCPGQFVAESFIDEFPGYPELNGLRFLWPRTNVGRTYVIEKLQEAGAYVNSIEAYRTTEPDNACELGKRVIDLVQSGQVQAITLASSQTVRNLVKLMANALKSNDNADNRPANTISLDNVIIAVIGPETARTARELLGRVDAVAENYTIDGLVNALTDYVAKNAQTP